MSHQGRSTQCSLSLNFALMGFSCRSERAISIGKNRESLQSLTDNQQLTTTKKCSTSAKLFFFTIENQEQNINDPLQ